MGKERMNEVIFSVDEENKVLLAQRTVIEEFDTFDSEKLVNERVAAIKQYQTLIKEMEEEITKINKYKSYLEKWKKEFIEDQKKQVEESNKKVKTGPSKPPKK